MNVSVYTPDRRVFEGEVNSITAPCIEGVVTILPRHMNYVSPMDAGIVEIKKASELTTFTIGKGVLFVENNKVTILIEEAKYEHELVELEILKAKEKAEEIIAKGTKDEILQARYLLRRSLVDLRMIKKRRRIGSV